jgi:hypothetical protein
MCTIMCDAACRAEPEGSKADKSGGRSSHVRLPTPLAWEAVQAYLETLQLPGACAYGAFHSALMGQALACLRMWCKSSNTISTGGRQVRTQGQ